MQRVRHKCALTLACALSLSHVQFFMTPWTVTLQAPLFMEILQARILEWLPWRLPGDLPNPVIEPRFPTLQVNSLPCEPPGKPQGQIQKTTCWHEGAPKGGLGTGAHRSGPQHKLSLPLPSLGQHVPPHPPAPGLRLRGGGHRVFQSYANCHFL